MWLCASVCVCACVCNGRPIIVVVCSATRDAMQTESLIESVAIVPPPRRPRPRRLATDNAIRWRSAEWPPSVRSLARSFARSKSIVSLAPDRCTLVNFRRLQLRRPSHQLRCTVSSRHCLPAPKFVCLPVCVSRSTTIISWKRYKTETWLLPSAKRKSYVCSID